MDQVNEIKTVMYLAVITSLNLLAYFHSPPEKLIMTSLFSGKMKSWWMWEGPNYVFKPFKWESQISNDEFIERAKIL